MTIVKVIRYQTKPDSADENERLVRAVFSELSTTKPQGFSYSVFRLVDTVSFVHVAVIDGDYNPLFDSGAFADFQIDIAERCVTGPNASDATTIGSYRPVS